MQASEFLTALADLDTANPDTVQDFLVATQARSSANLPKPVPIGTHDGIQYFIQSDDKTIHQESSSAAIPPAETGDIFYGISTYEAKSIPTGRTLNTDLNYGFGLGRLHHKSSEAADMEDTGFHVICNAVDKSIWVAFDFEPYGETGDINPVQPEYGDPYGGLPLDTQRMEIRIMRLFTKVWTAQKPLSLDGGDPFRNGAGIPLPYKLVARPALVADVLNAIKAGTTEPGLRWATRTSREPKAS